MLGEWLLYNLQRNILILGAIFSPQRLVQKPAIVNVEEQSLVSILTLAWRIKR